MDTTTAFSLAVVALSAVLLVLVAVAEAGIIAITRARIRSGPRNGVSGLLDRYIRRRHAILATLSVASTALTVAGTTALLLLAFADEPLRPAGAAAVAAGTALIATLLRQTARGLALINPERAGLKLARPIAVLRIAFAPLVWTAQAPINAIFSVLGRRLDEPPDPAEELLAVLQAPDDPEMAEALSEERRMMRGVLELSKQTVRELMSPRVEIVAISTEGTPQALLELINRSGRSRIPLYEESIDRVVGVIYAKDLLAFMQQGQVIPDLEHLARPPYFVPETKRADELLADLRRDQVHMAIAVDEYGGTAGVVTVEDLIEEIVGEITDEYDLDEVVDVERVDGGEAIVDARLPIDDLNELFDTHVDSADFDTVGGFIFSLLGRLAVPGDEVTSEEHGLRLRVLSIRGRRIKRVQIVRIQPAEETAEAV